MGSARLSCKKNPQLSHISYLFSSTRLVDQSVHKLNLDVYLDLLQHYSIGSYDLYQNSTIFHQISQYLEAKVMDSNLLTIKAIFH